MQSHQFTALCRHQSVLRPVKVWILTILLLLPCWSTSGLAKGWDHSELRKVTEVLASRKTKNLLVTHRGATIHEWYSAESGPKKRHYTASLAKALVGGLSLMLALQDGRLQLDDTASKFIPEWRDDLQRAGITIRHLATHSSGIENAEQDNLAHRDLPGWKGAFWRRDPDPFSIAIRQAPVVFEPGTRFDYSNPGMAALAYAVTASLRGTRWPDLRTLLRERIMSPLGIGEDEWSIGYGQTYNLDDLDLVANWGGGSFTARAVAKIGQLLLQRGNWNGRQLLSPYWVDLATSYAGTPVPERGPGDPYPASGICWWVNSDGIWSEVPRDAFAGAGAGQQVLLVVPSRELVVVRNGGPMNRPEEETSFWGGLEQWVFNPVMRAGEGYYLTESVLQRLPYPPSRVIKEIRFSPKSTIVRKAAGSDNWPITWAADDRLYTAYGDGWGFEPLKPEKLSLGLAAVTGRPESFVGSNIDCPTLEQKGQGPSGRKASGLLSIDDRLYMWVRNAHNSQLAWSDNRGTHWRWSKWKFTTSFSHPTFLNFGKDYQGSRDEFVYVYSPDNDSAYEGADQMVLARVPKDRVLNRDSYEFLSGFNAGSPIWSSDIEQRWPVFVHPGRCYRSSISYDAGIQRYLWIQILPGEAPRFFGGFGIYEAPEPWGPWTTAYFTEHWDVGPGENAYFPTKWMSDDGTVVYMVFSGDDHFSVRRAEIALHE